jgi:hypothetical protein
MLFADLFLHYFIIGPSTTTIKALCQSPQSISSLLPFFHHHHHHHHHHLCVLLLLYYCSNVASNIRVGFFGSRLFHGGSKISSETWRRQDSSKILSESFCCHCSRGVNIVFRLSRPGLHHGDRPAPVALHSSASVSAGI